MSLLDSLIRLEQLLKCKICDNALNKTYVVGECGHNFCYTCVSEKLGKDAKCPTCHLPAVIKNLHKSLMYDNILAHTLKLKQVVLRDSQALHSQETSSITIVKPLQLDSSSNNEQLGEGKRSNDTLGKLFTSIDTNGIPPPPLSQIKEEESTKGNSPDKPNEKEEPAKETSSNDDDSSNHAKKRKLSVGKSSDNNGIEANGFSVMDGDKKQSDDAQGSETWKCKWCLFEHEAYIQTCSICHKYKGSEYVPRTLQNNIQSTSTTQSSPPLQQQQSSNQDVPKKRKLEPEMDEIHILQTGLTEKEEISFKRILTLAAKNGMRIVAHHDLKKFDQVTHVITSVDKNGLCKRTLKYLSSIIYGKWIVDHTWLSHSVKREQWLREQPYEVKGDHSTGKTHAPSIGRKNHEEKRLLFGEMYFYFSGDFPSKYNKKDISQLCQSAGGTLLKRKPTLTDSNLESTIIIHPDSSKGSQHWLDDFQVKDPSWVIDSISKQSTA